MDEEDGGGRSRVILKSDCMNESEVADDAIAVGFQLARHHREQKRYAVEAQTHRIGQLMWVGSEGMNSGWNKK